MCNIQIKCIKGFIIKPRIDIHFLGTSYNTYYNNFMCFMHNNMYITYSSNLSRFLRTNKYIIEFLTLLNIYFTKYLYYISALHK